MEVNRTNFSAVLLELERSVLDEATFLAIDGEFTGLTSGPDGAAFDTHAEYYTKTRLGSMNFLFVQFGLCAFRYHAADNKWTHRAYNFYIFPKAYNRHSDARFLCQASSIEFLSENNFDFNALFSRGIPFMSMSEEQRERESLEERQTKERSQNTSNRDHAPMPIPDDMVDYVNNFCSRVDDFLLSDTPVLDIKPTNAFQRKLLYQTTEERYSQRITLETQSVEGSRVLVVSRIQSEEARLRCLQEKHEKELQELENAVGFSKVIRLVSGCGKLVVGHNMLLDVCHVLDKFCDRLPVDYVEFKDMAHEAFPLLIDTKYMSGCRVFHDRIGSNMLSDLKTTMQQEPFCIPHIGMEAEGVGYLDDVDKFHEAGYDAYITGQCFIALARSLDVKGLHPSVIDLPLLKPYLNRILLSRIQDTCYVNLSGSDPLMPRDHVFHVKFPREWKQSDLVNLFKPVGNVYVSWLSDCTAYVSVYEREKAASVLKLLPRSSDYSIVSYQAHHRDKEQSTAFTPHSPVQRRPNQADNTSLKRKRDSLPGKESKVTRRSIDTIVEEEAADVSPVPKAATAKVQQRHMKHFPETDEW